MSGNRSFHQRLTLSQDALNEPLSPLSLTKMNPSDPAQTVAVVGASTDRRKFGNKGTRAFIQAGWRVFPVNPNEPEVEGLPTVATVADIPGPLDVVSLYVPAPVGVKLLPGIATKQPGVLWINPGAESDELLAAASDLGLKAVRLCSIIAVGFNPADFP